MNPPGKALKRGVTHTADTPAHPGATPEKAPKKGRVTDTSGCAPVFKFMGLFLLVVGLLCVALGTMTFLLTDSSSSVTSIVSGVGCLFWSAMMYALAEALTRLAEISFAVRKQAGE